MVTISCMIFALGGTFKVLTTHVVRWLDRWSLPIETFEKLL
jgi:hypothetical protein